MSRTSGVVAAGAGNLPDPNTVAHGGTGSTTAAGAIGALGGVAKAGDTMTGRLTLSADPTSALHAATKQYVDGLIARINVRDYGAKGDGTTDDSAAIQAAINAAVNATFAGIGVEVWFPTGKYYCATGLTCILPGVAFVGEGQVGISDDLASGDTQIIVGDGQWGLTLGNTTSEYRGYRVERLHFYEKNAGGAYGGLRIQGSSLGTYRDVAVGRFTKSVTTTYAGTNGAALSTLSTLTLASTANWPTAGVGIATTLGGTGGQIYHSFTYTGVSGSTLTGCVFSTPTTDTIASGATVQAAVGVGALVQGGSGNAATTFSGTNGAALSTLSSLTLTTTAGWLPTGGGAVVTSGGTQSFTYTSVVDGTHLGGCVFSGTQTNTVASGAAVQSTPWETSNNHFDNVRTGTCTIGFLQVGTSLSRLVDCMLDGGHNIVDGSTIRAGSVGLFAVSGTILSTNCEVQAYDTLIHLGKANQEHKIDFRLEGWKSAGIVLEADAGAASCFIEGFGQSNVSGKGTGLVVNAGVNDAMVDIDVNALSPIVDNGTRTRFKNQSGQPLFGPSVVGTVVGRVPQYNLVNQLIGYSPIYNTVSGIYLVRDLGGADPGTTGLTTATRTLTLPVNVGDWLVIAGGYGLGSTVAVTVADSKGNTYTVQTHGDLNSGLTPHSFVATAPVTAAMVAGDTITVTFGSAVNYPIFYGFEIAGVIAGGSYVDVSNSATGTGTSPTVSLTTTADYDYLFAAVEHSGATTFTPTAGITLLDTATSTGKTTDLISVLAGTAGATSIGGTLNTSTDWAISAIAIKKA